MNQIRLFTIGFTKKSAEQFFTKLSKAGVKRVIDIRLNNVSQLAGFAKQEDLRYFLKTICNIDYLHIPEFAPTKEIMDAYKKKKGDWAVYEKGFMALLAERKPEKSIARGQFDRGCLLCSEYTPDNCHRRLVADYLNRKWGDIEVVHIL
ncbi:MAG: DUF488 domain-containing protein [Pseudomonadota bacterium]|nr:DUF488 domain-containing protein [Desulfobacterales bacterium]MBL6967135.1 DUF488 domain-containing protein [Desulfobacteraceae bacterium]MBL7102558.1 DUF488 domain-containing protein [Desulfobacteraceae bacterium]MBL7172170.1 DUF488 domain-containing protein [Desulfobacteraceae bacterium]